MHRRPTRLAVLALILSACAGAAATASAKTVWLCRPGLAHSECGRSLTATVVPATGASHVEHVKAAKHPAIDCFYVYPTASSQTTTVAALKPDSGVTNTVRSQFSRFAAACRPFAPLYRQITLIGLGKIGSLSAHDRAVGYDDVLAAWKEYLARWNHGRGVVLIGHSQGAGVLTRLIAQRIEKRPSERRRLVSAIILGGNVAVKKGRDVGGSFQHVRACHRATQIGCVIAYSSFLETPPDNTLFGRPNGTLVGKSGKSYRVLCVNPAALDGSEGRLRPYFTVNGASGLLGGLGSATGITTPWLSYPRLYTARCRTVGDKTWLQVTPTRPTGGRRLVTEYLGPTWGLHLFDVGLAWGNFVSIVRREAAAYVKARG